MSTLTVAPSYDDLADLAREPLMAFAFKLSRDHNLAGDLVQETLIIAHRKFEKFDTKRGSFKSWCNSILLNKWRDYLRSAKRREIVVSALSTEGDLSDIAEPAAMRALTIDVEDVAMSNVRLDAMLARLNKTERRIAVALSKGVNDEEIQQQLHISPCKYDQIILSMRSKLADYA